MLSGIQAAQFGGLRNPADAQHIGRGSHSDFAIHVNLQHVVEAGLHDALQAVVNVLRFPEQVLLVLHPFEVGNGDAAGVAKDVRNNENAFGFQDPSASGVNGPLAASAMIFAWSACGVLAVDGIFQRGGNQDFALHGRAIAPE